MEAESAMTFINTVGFPIAAFLLMYHMMNSTIKENTTETKNLTLLIQTLIAKLEA
jgi:hypothetical protein